MEQPHQLQFGQRLGLSHYITLVAPPKNKKKKVVVWSLAINRPPLRGLGTCARSRTYPGLSKLWVMTRAKAPVLMRGACKCEISGLEALVLDFWAKLKDLIAQSWSFALRPHPNQFLSGDWAPLRNTLNARTNIPCGHSLYQACSEQGSFGPPVRLSFAASKEAESPLKAAQSGVTSNTTTKVKSAQHVFIYHRPGKFAGWPANHGMWCWGDEILVGFSAGDYKDLGPGRHAIDREKPEEHLLARSLDGGETWSIENPAAQGVLIGTAGERHGTLPPGAHEAEPVECPGDKTHASQLCPDLPHEWH